jgi:type IV pilus assembly protein PilC
MATATAPAPTKFDYSVRDKAGKLQKGSLEAPSEAVAVSRLRGMGLAPIKVSQAGAGVKKEITFGSLGKKKVKLKDLAIFARQFATMVDSGLSLIRALHILTEQTDNKELAKVIVEVRNDVETGSALSTAMAKHQSTFPPLMVNMCKAGEVGGFLDEVMLQIAANYEAEVKLRGKVKSAMTYPTVVFVIAIVAVIGMLLFIVPTFAGLFKSFGGTLPAPTRFLVFLSSALKLMMPVLVIGVFAGLYAWRKVRYQERVRRVVDPIKLKMPVFGNLMKKIALARFCRNLGTLMRSGVPILQSLDIVADASGNVVIADAARAVQQSVRQGESLAAPLSQHAVFPAMVVQMMAVGEDTGALDSMLTKIAEFYDQEVEATTEALTALIEPLMIAGLGSVVGAMIVALYMPIFKLMDLVK